MAASPHSSTLHVFVLDDDEGILQLQRRALERAGYRVSTAEHAARAEAIIRQSVPDLLVLDYSLNTGATGLDFYRSLRHRNIDVPAILVTGFSDEGRAIEALRAGVRDVIPKVGDYLEYLPDAVERVLAQVGAAKALAEAEAAGRAKDRFLAILSHELRTPLTPVLTGVQLLQSSPDLTPQARETLAMIQRNVELEARLIDDLLDLPRIARGKLRLQPSPTDVHERLSNALQTIENDARGKRLRVAVELSATRTTVNADPARLQQIFWNVLKNAVKFTPEGGSVSVRTIDDGADHIRVEVSDTGIGIAPAALDGIFNAFEQASTAVTRQFGGLGLGLNIAKALVEAHGGQITAASEGAGRGAVFTMRFPLCSTDENEVGDRAKLSDISFDNAAAARPHVLLVEDHRDTATMMVRLLNLSGHKVTTVDSVAAALSVASTQRFDVVVSDIGLPDGSGLDLMRQLLSRQPIKGIALSGFGMEEDLARSREAGFAEHLVKPINVDQLEQALQRIAKNSADQQTN